MPKAAVHPSEPFLSAEKMGVPVEVLAAAQVAPSMPKAAPQPPVLLFPLGRIHFSRTPRPERAHETLSAFLRQSGWPWRWLCPSHTIYLQRPIFRKTGTVGRFLNGIAGFLSLRRAVFRQFKKDKHEEIA
jgi:hypothetical protein